jgi:hypothetical protein
VKVEVDAHNAVEVLADELVQDEEVEEEPFFVPAFTITITNHVVSGNQSGNIIRGVPRAPDCK